MLSSGNTKLGKIPNWNLQAIKTCPGRSKLCESLCYADSGFFRMDNVQKSYIENRRLTRLVGWVKNMIAEITKKKHKIVRIHSSGDFVDLEYIHKWIEIAKGCPKTVFYCYTRSWRRPELLTSVVELGSLPNVELWFSVDRETGQGPSYPGIKQAYLAVDDTDVPQFPVDLIFRNTVKTVQKKLNGVQVCPYETGIKANVTCEKCKICFKETLTTLGT